MIRSFLKKGLGRILGGRSSAPPQPKPYPFKYEGAKKPAKKAAPPPAEVKPPQPEPVEAAPETPEEIELLSVGELRKRLAAKGIKPRSKARKPELLDMLAAASGGGNGDEDAATPPGLDRDAVQELLDDMVRPALQADGGDILLVEVVGTDVHVRLVGACTTCPSSVMTMKMGVEALFREEFPGFGELVQVN